MCRFIVPIALSITAFASGALAQGSWGAAPPVAEQAGTTANASAVPLTLSAAVQLALDNNPELSSARREIEATEGARVQAGAFPNPTMDIEVEDLRRQTRTTTVLFSQPLEIGGKRGARIEAAERAIDVARAQLDAKRADLRANVTAAFFATAISQERVRLAEASLELARTGSSAAGKRVTAGKVSPVEETRAKVAEANVRLELVQARGELQTNLQLLRALTTRQVGIDAVNGDVLALPNPSPQELLEARIVNAPSLRQARLEVRRFGALSELERAKRLPDITVTAGGMRDQEAGRNQAVIGISVPLPIFDTNRGNITEALRRQDKAEDDARALELRLRSDVGAARQRLLTASAEVDALQKEILPGAQSAFDAATKGFELGKFSYLDALDAQRTLLQARSQYLRSLAEAHKSVTDLDRLLGAPVAQGANASTP